MWSAVPSTTGGGRGGLDDPHGPGVAGEAAATGAVLGLRWRLCTRKPVGAAGARTTATILGEGGASGLTAAAAAVVGRALTGGAEGALAREVGGPGATAAPAMVTGTLSDGGRGTLNTGTSMVGARTVGEVSGLTLRGEGTRRTDGALSLGGVDAVDGGACLGTSLRLVRLGRGGPKEGVLDRLLDRLGPAEGSAVRLGRAVGLGDPCLSLGDGLLDRLSPGEG